MKNRFYCFARDLAGLVYRIGGIRIQGKENIPQQETALLIIGNHVSYGDAVVVAMSFPFPILFIAKEQFAHYAWTRRLFNALGAVFLKKGESDLGAMRAVMHELTQGHSVAIFPEGRRNHDQVLGPFQPGASYISQRAQARVLPMAMINTGDYWRVWRRNVLVKIGEPIDPPPLGGPDKTLLDQYTELYRTRLLEMVEELKAQINREGKKMRQLPRSRQGQYPALPEK